MKGAVIHLRVTADEQAAIQKAAEDAGMTVSAFVRSLSLQGAGVTPFLNADDRKVMRVLHEDMRAIGVNLNQVARALNSKREVHDNEVGMVLSNVERVAKFTLLELKGLAMRGRSKGEPEAAD